MSGADLALRVLGTMLAGLAAAAPELFDLLSPSEREAFDSIIARGKGHLPAAGAAHAAVAAIFATAPTQPAPSSVASLPLLAAKHAVVLAEHPRISAHHADVLARLAADSMLTVEQRVALSESAMFIHDVVDPAPSPLAPPVLFGEPDHGED